MQDNGQLIVPQTVDMVQTNRERVQRFVTWSKGGVSSATKSGAAEESNINFELLWKVF